MVSTVVRMASQLKNIDVQMAILMKDRHSRCLSYSDHHPVATRRHPVGMWSDSACSVMSGALTSAKS